MTSRERVQALLQGKPIDRVPNGLGGCETAGMHILAYDTLKKVLGVDDRTNRMYTFMTNAVFEPSVLEAMHGDIIILNSKMCSAPLWGETAAKSWKEETFWDKQFQIPNEWSFRKETDGTIVWKNIGWVCPPGGIYFDPPPSETTKAEEEFKPGKFNPSHDIPYEVLKETEKSARWLHDNTDYAICVGESIRDLQVKVGGIEQWWMRLIDSKDGVHEYLGKACEAGIAQLKLVDQAVGKYGEMMMIADDIGDIRGVTIGPDLWREIYKPHYKKLFTEWHDHSSLKISMHSCGSIADILDDLIECGLDIINPVQISAAGMGPSELMQQYADRIIFYGGCYDSVKFPKTMDEEAVYQGVTDNLHILAHNNNYIFAGVHNLPGDMPEHHIRGFLQAYWDFCGLG